LKMFKRTIPLWAFILAVLASASVVIGAIMFTTPTVTNTMSLGATYNLELYYAKEIGTKTPTTWILVPSEGSGLDWGIFNNDESKFWYLKIKNKGNIVANVCWRKQGWDTEAGKWIFLCDLGETGAWTNEGTTKALAVGAEMVVKLAITEDTAEPGIVYSFGVFFENNDTPIP